MDAADALPAACLARTDVTGLGVEARCGVSGVRVGVIDDPLLA